MIESPNERETLETFQALLITERRVFLKNATEAYESTLSSNSSEFEKVMMKLFNYNIESLIVIML